MNKQAIWGPNFIINRQNKQYFAQIKSMKGRENRDIKRHYKHAPTR